MTKMNELETNYTELNNIRDQIPRVFLDIKKRLAESEDAVLRDTSLSREAQSEKLSEIRAYHFDELMKDLQGRNELYNITADRAISDANDIILNEPDRPNDAEVSEFDRSLLALKNNMLLARNTTTALEDLDKFVDKITSPYFARRASSEFVSLATSLMDRDNSSRVKLNHINSKINAFADTDEQKRARQVKETAIQLKERGISSAYSMYFDSVSKTFGPRLANYIHNPEAYQPQQD
ncbi:hypothetical protein [Bacillus pumilus]|uniref:hypothetical protein n=1 Tax=Bacillus pumilus TaxID=1408 RepID=UPI000DE599D1|nr:hypothetical protein [Bacillus pumilus]